MQSTSRKPAKAFREILRIMKCQRSGINWIEDRYAEQIWLDDQNKLRKKNVFIIDMKSKQKNILAGHRTIYFTMCSALDRKISQQPISQYQILRNNFIKHKRTKSENINYTRFINNRMQHKLNILVTSISNTPAQV